jgi:hypothetical protein
MLDIRTLFYIRFHYHRTLFCLGLCCGRFLKLTGSLFAVELSFCDCVEMKVSRGNVLFPTGTRTHVRISVALVAQYLNVRQLKLGTIIIQTVHVSYSMIVWSQAHCKWKTL